MSSDDWAKIGDFGLAASSTLLRNNRQLHSQHQSNCSAAIVGDSRTAGVLICVTECGTKLYKAPKLDSGIYRLHISSF